MKKLLFCVFVFLFGCSSPQNSQQFVGNYNLDLDKSWDFYFQEGKTVMRWDTPEKIQEEFNTFKAIREKAFATCKIQNDVFILGTPPYETIWKITKRNINGNVMKGEAIVTDSSNSSEKTYFLLKLDNNLLHFYYDYFDVTEEDTHMVFLKDS